MLWPKPRLPFQLQQLLNSHCELCPPAGDRSTFQAAVTATGSPKSSTSVQPSTWKLLSLVTAISTWKLLPQPLVPVTEQLTGTRMAPELLVDDEELLEDELELLVDDELEDEDELLDELELLDDELLLEDELELLLEPLSSA